MFAVIKTGGKQYRVAVGDIISVEKLDGEAGATVSLGDVLMHGGGDGMTVGAPFVDGASVTAEVLEQFKGEKVRGLKKRRRKHGSQRRWGHRQQLTRLKIAGIPGDEDGSKSAKKGAEAATTVQEHVPAHGTPPGNLMAQAPDERDDLTKLPGIGNASQTVLNDMGIYTYGQFLAWNDEEWDHVEAEVEGKLNARVDLVREMINAEAKRLMDGDE